MGKGKKRGCFGKTIFGLFIALVLVATGIYYVNPDTLEMLISRYPTLIGVEGQKETVSLAPEEVEGRFYYAQLSEEDQIVYQEILQGIKEFKMNIQVHGSDVEHVGDIYQKVLYDSPELFWCTGDSTTTSLLNMIKFVPKYTCSAEEKEQRQSEIDIAVQKCMDGAPIDGSAYNKIKYVYEYLVDQTDYQLNASDSQNIYSVFVNKVSVCAGYAKATQYLLKKLGIECIYVTGTTGDDGQLHAWNIAKIDGEYYHVDTTWGDPVFVMQEDNVQNVTNISYDYLCCNDVEISRTHTWDSKLGLPSCTSNQYNYYILNGCYYESYDPNQILKAMNDSIYSGETQTIFKFSSNEVYQQAKDPIIHDLASKAMQNLMNAYGLESVSCGQMTDDNSNKIIIYWEYES